MTPDKADFWWQDETNAAHEAVFAYVQSIEQQQSHVTRRAEAHASLYANRELIGGRDSGIPRQYAVTENVVASCVDTAVAMIAGSLVRATFQTDGADWSTARRAKKLEHFVDATCQRLRVDDTKQLAFRDGCIYGTGGVKIVASDGDISFERVVMGPVPEIIVDEETCNNCDPHELFQRKWVDRAVLAAMYPEHAEAIKNAVADFGPHAFRRQSAKHQIPVVMAWRLPSSPGAGDGRYVMCLKEVTLEDSVYTKDALPFVFFRWTEPLTGFYGMGIAEALVGIQLRLNKLNKFVAKCQDMIAVPRVFGNFGQKGVTARIDNDIGAMINTRDGKPPTFYTPPAVAPETYAEREYLYKRAYELTGISMLSAASKKPAGVDSKVALRELTDTESSRFAPVGQRFERMHIDIARLFVEVGKEVFRGKKAKASFKARHFTETIAWDDVDPKEDIYSIDIEAASIESRTPAGRVQMVSDLQAAGLVDTDTGRDLLDLPDLRRYNDQFNAPHRDIEALIENLQNGKWESPEPMQDLAGGIKQVQMQYLHDRREGAPEEVLDLMRRWMSQAQTELAKAAPPPIQPQAATPMSAIAAQGSAPM